MPAAERREDGFTLVELLLAISVMLVIIVPLSGSFILGIGTANNSLQDTTNSADAQALAGFVDTDVTNSEAVAATGPCGGPDTVLHLAWTDGTQAVTVAYRSTPDPAMMTELNTTTPLNRLERVRCVNGSAVQTTLVARSVLRTGGVELRCDGALGCPSPKPRRVQLTITSFAQQLKDAAPSPTRYTYGVTATRKVTS